MADLNLWLCPHKVIKYEEARQMLLYKPPDAEHNYEEIVFPCENSACSFAVESTIRHRLISSHTVTLATSILLLVVDNCYDPAEIIRRFCTTNRIKLALTKLDFPICKHLRTSDPFVYNHYTPKCTEHQGLDGSLSACSCGKFEPRALGLDEHYRYCPECVKYRTVHTMFGFRTSLCGEGGVKSLILCLDLSRHLGRLDDYARPEWTLHAIDSAQAACISWQWERWMEYRRKISGRETWPATPIFEGMTIKHLHDEFHSLFSNFLSWMRKLQRFLKDQYDSSNIPTI